MKDKDILFAIAVLGFFGINGLDLLNAINALYVKLGNWFFVLLFFAWAYLTRK